MANLKKVAAMFDQDDTAKVDALIEFGICDSSGEKLTEAKLREILKLDDAPVKRARKSSSGPKANEDAADRCSAAIYKRTKGDYAKARCKGADCTLDDGNGNLLCEDCAGAWDVVSKKTIGGCICYGIGVAQKAKIGAEWMGIYGVDVPPVFVDGGMSEAKAWNAKLRENLGALAMGGDYKNGVWHKPLTPWDKQLTEDTTEVAEDTTEEDTTEEDTTEQDTTEQDTSGDDTAAELETTEIDGVSYFVVGVKPNVCLYPAYKHSRDEPDHTDPDAAWCGYDEDDGVTIEWYDEAYEKIHDDAACAMQKQ